MRRWCAAAAAAVLLTIAGAQAPHNYLDNRASFTFTPEALATIDKGIAPTTAGNPLDDITAVRRVRFVMKSGAVVRNVAR